MTPDEIVKTYEETSALIVAEHRARMDAIVTNALAKVQGTKDAARIAAVRARLANDT